MLATLGVTPFAVLDVETTGVYTGGRDRVIEVAVIRFRPDTGAIDDEYVTLVNPRRDVGSTRIHGIEAGDILKAPEFGEIAGDVAQRLEGAILVAHNARFDVALLAAEFRRLGIEMPTYPTLCTLRLAYRLSRAPSRSLSACCASEGVEHVNPHTAYGDAQATLDLFLRYLRRLGSCSLLDLGCEDAVLPDPGWVKRAPSRRALARCQAAALRAEERGYLSRLVARLPGTEGSTVREAEYLCLLDRVLEDRALTAAEAEGLCATAKEWGLGQTELRCAHQAYVWALAREARADGIVTESERRDLVTVCELLGVEGATLAQILDVPGGGHGVKVEQPSHATSLAGQSVCFTGELRGPVDGSPMSRAMAEDLARQAGMFVKKGVSGTLDILVVADPDTQSGKSKKARELGTRIMAEAVFWKELGELAAPAASGSGDAAGAGREMDVEVHGHEATVRRLAGGGERTATATLSSDGVESVLVAIDGVLVGRLADDDAAELESLVRKAELRVNAIVNASGGGAAVTLLDVPEARESRRRT